MNCWTKSLVKKYNGKKIAFKELPLGAKMSMIWYMAVNGEAWEIPDTYFGKFNENRMKNFIRRNMDYFNKEYGNQKFGIVTIPVSELIKAFERATIQNNDIYKSFNAWLKDYEENKSGGIPNHKNQDWCPILGCYKDDNLFQDGWHRFACYVKQGAKEITCLYY